MGGRAIMEAVVLIGIHHAVGRLFVVMVKMPVLAIVVANVSREVSQGLCDTLPCICWTRRPVRGALMTGSGRTMELIGPSPRCARIGPAGDRNPHRVMFDRAAGSRFGPCKGNQAERHDAVVWAKVGVRQTLAEKSLAPA